MKLKLTVLILMTLMSEAYSQTIEIQKIYGNGTGFGIRQTADKGYILYGGADTTSRLIKLDSNGIVLWSKSYDAASACSFAQTADGGYVLPGNSNSANSAMLIKTDANGDTLWTKTYPTPNPSFAYSVIQTSDGGYIISGNKSNGLDRDAYIIKTNSTGDTVWTKTYGIIGANLDDEAYSVIQTLDGGFAMIGYTRGTGAGGADVYFIKTNSSGDTLWTKTFGDVDDDYGFDLVQKNDGTYILTGTLKLSGQEDVALIKTDANGNWMWTKTIGDSLQDDEGHSIEITQDDGLIITGICKKHHDMTTHTTAGLLYLVKTNAIGDTMWTKAYGGIHYQVGQSVRQTYDKGFVALGMTTSFGNFGGDIYLVKTDSIGDCTQVIAGINESSISGNLELMIAPNPGNGVFDLHIKHEGNIILEVYNDHGESINRQTLINEYTKLDLSSYSAGLYFIRVIQNNNAVIIRKVIIAK